MWPNTSFNFVSLTAWPSNKSSRRIFSTSACLPVHRWHSVRGSPLMCCAGCYSQYCTCQLFNQPLWVCIRTMLQLHSTAFKHTQASSHGLIKRADSAELVQCSQCKSPACRLTPAASYMTIKLKAKLTANSGLPMPSSKAMDVVTACKLPHTLLSPLMSGSAHCSTDKS